MVDEGVEDVAVGVTVYVTLNTVGITVTATEVEPEAERVMRSVIELVVDESDKDGDKEEEGTLDVDDPEADDWAWTAPPTTAKNMKREDGRIASGDARVRVDVDGEVVERKKKKDEVTAKPRLMI